MTGPENFERAENSKMSPENTLILLMAKQYTL